MAKTLDAPDAATAAPASKPQTYTFRKNGTDRTWEIDADHVDIMRKRNDLTYIGSAPLPPPRNEGVVIR